MTKTHQLINFVKMQNDWYLRIKDLLAWLETQQELSGPEAAELCKYLHKEITAAIGRNAVGLSDDLNP